MIKLIQAQIHIDRQAGFELAIRVVDLEFDGLNRGLVSFGGLDVLQGELVLISPVGCHDGASAGFEIGVGGGRLRMQPLGKHLYMPACKWYTCHQFS